MNAMNRRFLSVALVRATTAICALLGVSPTICRAAIYNVKDLGTLGGSSSYGYGINANGQVAGYALKTGNTAGHAFYYDGVIHDLGTLGGTQSFGRDVNDSGQITGDSNTNQGPDHAFVYNGAMHDIGTLGGRNSQGFAINSRGQVAGYADVTGDLTSHAFLYDGTMHDLGSLGGKSYGQGLNDNGIVTGFSYLPGDVTGVYHAFVYNGTIHDLGTLGGTSSVGYSVNASGKIVGYSQLAGDSAQHAFLYDGTMHDLGTIAGDSVASDINSFDQITGFVWINGNAATRAIVYDSAHGMLDLNSLISPSSGWVLSEGIAINDSGQITGFGTIGGAQHAFLLTPVPEPSTFVLTAFGVIGILGFFRRPRNRRLVRKIREP